MSLFNFVLLTPLLEFVTVGVLKSIVGQVYVPNFLRWDDDCHERRELFCPKIAISSQYILSIFKHDPGNNKFIASQ